MNAGLVREKPWAFVVLGLCAGLLSGIFGVGGGVLIVPALVLFAGIGQRLAHGTSLAAVIPIALSGVAGYAIDGAVDLTVGVLLIIGSTGGAILGTYLLQKLPQGVLRTAFAVLTLLTAARLALEVPSRAAHADVGVGQAIGLVVLGVLIGTLSGLLGVGGGIFMVPALILLFGVGDVVAKGTSLLVVIPTGIVATIQNVRRGNADIGVALVLGVSGIVSAYAGSQLAQLIPPRLSTILFAVLLVVTATRLVTHGRKVAKTPAPVSGGQPDQP